MTSLTQFSKNSMNERTRSGFEKIVTPFVCLNKNLGKEIKQQDKSDPQFK